MAIGKMIGQIQKERHSLASLAHYEYRQKCAGEGDLRVVRKRTLGGVVEGVVEELEIVANLAMIATCWLQSNRICGVLLIDEMVQVVDRNFVEVVRP